MHRIKFYFFDAFYLAISRKIYKSSGPGSGLGSGSGSGSGPDLGLGSSSGSKPS